MNAHGPWHCTRRVITLTGGEHHGPCSGCGCAACPAARGCPGACDPPCPAGRCRCCRRHVARGQPPFCDASPLSSSASPLSELASPPHGPPHHAHEEPQAEVATSRRGRRQVGRQLQPWPQLPLQQPSLPSPQPRWPHRPGQRVLRRWARRGRAGLPRVRRRPRRIASHPPPGRRLRVPRRALLLPVHRQAQHLVACRCRPGRRLVAPPVERETAGK